LEYVHQELNRDVTSVAGHYRLVKEVRLPFQGRDLLVVVGHAAFDTACCGAGGCAYALVPGFVQSWKSGTNREGLALSLVEPIRDNGVRENLRQWLGKEENVQQVQFL
jgi:hypothetical protein